MNIDDWLFGLFIALLVVFTISLVSIRDWQFCELVRRTEHIEKMLEEERSNDC